MVLMRSADVLRRSALALVAASSLLGASPSPAADGDAPTASGTVRLTRAAYDRLKDDSSAETLHRATPDVLPSLLSARYDVRLEDGRARLDASYEILVRKADSGFGLPVAGLVEAVEDSGGRPALVTYEEGTMWLRFPAKGPARVAIRSALDVAFDGVDGAPIVRFPTATAPASRLTATSAIAGSGFEISVGPGGAVALPPGVARGLPSGAFVTLRWTGGGRRPDAGEKPVVVAETVDVVRPEREQILVRTLLRLTVSRAPVSEARVDVQPGSQLLSVGGPGDPSAEIDATGVATLRLAKPFSGDAVLTLLTARPYPPGDAPVDVRPARVGDAITSRAHLLVSPAPAREHAPVSSDGLTRTDLVDLPAVARPFATAGTRAWRVARPGARLVFRAPPRDLAPLADSVLHAASVTTSFGDGGSRTDVRRLLVETRRVLLPLPWDGAEEVVSVTVDGQPARPGRDGGDLAVVLPPAASPRHVVEVTTRRKAEVPRKGDLVVEAPRLPGAASVTTWTLVLPDDRRYRFVSSEGIPKAGWTSDGPTERIRLETSAVAWMPGEEPGVLTGVVTEASGAPLPGVSVEARTGSLVHGTHTDAAGRFRFERLPGGRSYAVTTSLPGFADQKRSVLMPEGAGAQLRVPMSPLAVDSATTVTAEMPVVDITKSSIGTTFNSDTLRALPRAKATTSAPLSPRSMSGGVEGGVAGGVFGGVPGGGIGSSGLDDNYKVDAAGLRSLPVSVEARGKRLVLSGPVTGGSPLSVRLRVRT